MRVHMKDRHERNEKKSSILVFMNTISPTSVSLFHTFFALLVFVHACIKNGETALMRAASAGLFTPVKLLLEAGADMNAQRNPV